MSTEWKRRLAGIVAIAVAVGALGFIALGDLGEDLVYYWSPTELLAAADPTGATVRLGGLVVVGSVEWDREAHRASFQVTDGKATVDVECTGNPPQMFREGIGVVVEGQLGADKVFHTDRVMVKHSNEYEAPPEGGHPGGDPFQTLVKEDS